MELKKKSEKSSQINNEDLYKLNRYFDGLRCLECLEVPLFLYQRKEEDNELLIIKTCKNNHNEIKPVNLLIKDRVLFSGNIKFEKLLYSDNKNLNKYYLICNKCKKIFDIGNGNNIQHEHFLYKYLYYKVQDCNEEKKCFDYNNFEKIYNKKKSEEKYIEKIKKLLKNNFSMELYSKYINDLEVEYFFIEELFNMYYISKEDNVFHNLINYADFKIKKLNIKNKEQFIEKQRIILNEIDELNIYLEKDEIINFNKINIIPFKNYSKIKININKTCYSCVYLKKSYFAISLYNDVLIYKKEYDVKTKEYNFKNILEIKNIIKVSDIINIKFLKDETLLVYNIGNDDHNHYKNPIFPELHFFSFNNDFTSFKEIDRILLKNVIKSLIQFSDETIITRSNTSLTLWKKTKLNKYQKVTSLRRNYNIWDVIEINIINFAYLLPNNLLFVNKETLETESIITIYNSNTIYHYFNKQLLYLFNNILGIITNDGYGIILINSITKEFINEIYFKNGLNTEFRIEYLYYTSDGKILAITLGKNNKITEFCINGKKILKKYSIQENIQPKFITEIDNNSLIVIFDDNFFSFLYPNNSINH